MMKEKLPVLRVRMLGGERVTYGDLPILHHRGGVTRALKLLLILLYNSQTGITRSRLLEDLYGREEVLDGANNLRVACYRLKRMLVEAGLPEYDYISIQDGRYRFEGPMKIEVDAHIFRRLISQAGEEEDEEQRIRMLKEVCIMYSGEFLSELSGEEWVVLEGMRYKEMYSCALQEVCDYLQEQREYEEVLKLCATACELYPFDEWQAVRIDCYMALNRYKEAYREYEDTAKLFFEELGISPSERMMKQMKILSGHLSRIPRDINEIKGGLKEKNPEEGAFYCSLPSFRDGYRLVRRIMERNGQSIYLMLCTIIDSSGRPMEHSSRLDTMSRTLHEAIKHSLRRCDSFTRYSPAQFLVLLVGTNRENCQLISDRILRFFSEGHRSWSRNLDCYISSVAEMESEQTRRSFLG